MTGVGFQPKAILLVVGALGEHRRDRASHALSRIRCGGRDDRSASSGHDIADAATSIDAARLSRNDAVVAVMTAAGVVDGLLDLQSFDSDGFTLVVDDVMPRDQRISYLALGGTGLTNAATGSSRCLSRQATSTIPRSPGNLTA